MTEKSSRNPSPVLPVAFGIAMLLGLYVGAYCWLVSPQLDTAVAPYRVFPEYPSLVQVQPTTMKQSPLLTFWQSVFFPVHHIDRHLRPRVWDSELH